MSVNIVGSGHLKKLQGKLLSSEILKFHYLCIYFTFRAVKFSTKLMGKALAKRIKCTILYATETGRSERFAKTLCEVFKHAFDAKVS